MLFKSRKKLAWMDYIVLNKVSDLKITKKHFDLHLRASDLVSDRTANRVDFGGWPWDDAIVIARVTQFGSCLWFEQRKIEGSLSKSIVVRVGKDADWYDKVLGSRTKLQCQARSVMSGLPLHQHANLLSCKKSIREIQFHGQFKYFHF